MEFQKVLETRRTVRKYSAGVTREQMEELLCAAQEAPSWKNSQTGRYYCVLSEEMVDKIRMECLPDAGNAGAQSPLPCPSPETERGTPFGVPPSFRSVRDADYQLDLRTPGSSPRRAMLRKQIRQMPNWRMKARGRPQMGQRL